MPRTTAELRSLVKQYLARQSGTKPDKSPVTSGFLTGKSVKKSDLSDKELATRDRIKARLKTLRQGTDVQTDRQAMRSRLSRNQGNPTIPTTPRPTPTRPTTGNYKPPISNLPGNTNPGPVPPSNPGRFPRPRPTQTPPTKPSTSGGTVSAVAGALPTNVNGKGTRRLPSLPANATAARQVQMKLKARRSSR
jgi:hypothetical protein